MSAIDALTNTSNSALLAAATSASKKNKDVDFSTILAAAMQPALPGMDNNQSSQMMMEMAMMQQMQSLVSRLEDTISQIEAAKTQTAGTNDTSAASNVTK